MRNPIHVLKSLEEKASVSNYQYVRLYRNLYNPEFYLLAYANIAKSQGSMTQGVDGQTEPFPQKRTENRIKKLNKMQR